MRSRTRTFSKGTPATAGTMKAADAGEADGGAPPETERPHARKGRHPRRTVSPDTYTILIVEDDSSVRESLQDLFELSGYNVVTAINGRDGLHTLQKLRPDLIIADIMMPVMDGITFLRRLRANRLTSLIPVILLTANHLMDTRMEGLALGADDYLTKPFHAQELIMRAGNMIQTRKQLLVSLYSKPSLVVSESQDEVFLRELREVIEPSIGDASLCIDDVCAELRLSRSTIQKRLKRITGLSFNIFLREFRLVRAQRLIQQNAGSVSDIAWQVGFSSLSYFSRSYKNHFGHSPRQQRA